MMKINIDKKNGVICWVHDGAAYEYRIDGEGEIFAQPMPDHIKITMRSGGHYFTRVITLTGEDVLHFDDLGNVAMFGDFPVKLRFDGLTDAKLTAEGVMVMTRFSLFVIEKNGETLREICAPAGYEYYRIMRAEPLSAVCAQLGGTDDKYGRNDWRFDFNEASNMWELVSVIQ